MSVAFVVAIIFLSVSMHETAHSVVIRRQGFPITRAGVGMPFPPMLKIHWRGVTWTLSPWLVGMYVSPDPADWDRIQQLSYRDQAWHLNAGVLSNFIAASVLFAAASGGWRAVVSLAAAAVLWLARRPITAYLLPALAVPLLVFLFVSLSQSWLRGSTGMGYAGLADVIPNDLHGWLVLAGVLNLSIGAFNSLPLVPLDNGKVCAMIVHRCLGYRVAEAFQLTGTVVVLALILVSFGSDLWAAVT